MRNCTAEAGAGLVGAGHVEDGVHDAEHAPVEALEQGEVPIGMEIPVEDDFIGIHPEMRDFIVPDEEGEPFSFAAPTSKFVRETHEAVHGFNNWNPTDSAKKVKDFVDSMSRRECIKENARTKLGCALSYERPPL